MLPTASHGQSPAGYSGIYDVVCRDTGWQAGRS
jgi:hypothetical protein